MLTVRGFDLDGALLFEGQARGIAVAAGDTLRLRLDLFLVHSDAGDTDEPSEIEPEDPAGTDPDSTDPAAPEGDAEEGADPEAAPEGDAGEGADPEAALRATNRKVERRIGRMEAWLAAEGRRLDEVSPEERAALWQRAKTLDEATTDA